MDDRLKPLPPDLLYTACNPDAFLFQTTDELETVDVVIGQERALESLEFGMRIRSDGYNVFALGPAGTGKLTGVRQVVSREAAAQAVPPDWCYVNNFAEPARPRALQLPPGHGKRFRDDIAQLIDELTSAIPAAFEGDEYRSRAEEIEQEAKEREANAFRELREAARQHRIILVETPTGFAFAPMGQNDEVLNPEQFKKLPEAEQKRIQEIVIDLQQRLQKILQRFPAWRKETKEKVKALNREVAAFAVTFLIEEVRKKYEAFTQVLRYLDDVRKDVIEHVQDFLASTSETPMALLGAMPEPDRFKRYQVNLLIDHGEQKTAPVVLEDLPSHSNLIGRIEYQAHMGTLSTDFTMIKAGALHKANGGYLILDAMKVLMQPFAWDALKRTLQAGEIRIESLERTLSLISTKSLEPEPIPLQTKLILVGERLLYYLLNAYDPEFCDLFKVAADFDESMDRDDDANQIYARLIGSLARREKLRPLDRSAVVRTIEHCARLSGDAEKLSTHLRSITDLLREADYWAGRAGRAVIGAKDVETALEHQIYRSERVRTRIYEAIRRGTLLIDTRADVVGQVNGLSVITLGDFAFGQPSRITATTHLGDGKVVDIEREAELGGAIHSKGVLILSSFLASRFAKGQPLSMAASLVFEQSYGPVEGDSASLAELCALLSSLAELPIRQSFAVTGSVNQHGEVQPIGGVNEKIEAFFDVCHSLGLSGHQGVLIPRANIKHLMLRKAVVDAVHADQFHIFAVKHVDEALELLTGRPAGARGADEAFPEDSVNGRVETALLKFSEIRQSFGGDLRGGENHD